MKKVDLRAAGLEEIGTDEAVLTAGGDTTLAYDIGSWLRASFQYGTSNYGGFATTVAKWLSQQ